MNLTDGAADEARRGAAAMRIIEEAGAVRYDAAGCPVNAYLCSRGLKPVGSDWSSDLRRHNRLWHADTRHEYVGMVVVLRDVTGVVVPAVHRTYLMRDGRRADHPSVESGWRVDDAKRSLGSLRGGHAVRLGVDPEADTIGVAEGVESTLAFAMKLQMPCWAGLSANGMAAMKIPSEIRRVIIGPDIGDKKGTGTKAAVDLRQRLLDDVRNGKRTKTTVEFLSPPVRGDRGDWADWAEQNSATVTRHSLAHSDR